MRRPTISAVIPLYNKGPYIERAIKSILNQKLQPDEIIVVNDGSTDDGPEIVKSFKNEKIKLINQENKGVSAARNKGIKEAKGELIALLDADDEWLPNHLLNKINLFKEYSNLGAIGSPYYIKNYKEKFLPEFKYVPTKRGIIKQYFKAIIYRNPTCGSVIVINSKVFKETGLFPVGMQRGEDNFMWSKIALKYPIGFVNEPSAIRHKDLEGRLSTKIKFIDDFPILDYIKDENLDLDNETYFYLKEFAIQKFLLRAHQAILMDNKEKAKYFINKPKNTKLFKKNYLKLILSFIYLISFIFCLKISKIKLRN